MKYIEVVRMALARERVDYSGNSIQLPLPDGTGKALKLIIGPVQERLPILLAALGPSNVKLTGAVADGWIPVFFVPEHVAELRVPVDTGAARGGRDPGEIVLCPQGVDLRRRRPGRGARCDALGMALYIGAMGPRDNNFYAKLVTRYGYADAAERIQELYLGGAKAEAAAAVPAELIDLVCLCGPVERIRNRLKAYDDAGVDTLIMIPAATDAASLTEQIRRVSEAAPEYLLRNGKK